jgi:hypothetical protein
MIVCLCGSTRFYREFQEANYRLTMDGIIVLTVGFYPHATKAMHGEGVGATSKQKLMLDELHKRKIDLCDEVYVLNVDDYIGESTRGEIQYAIRTRKRVNFMEPSNDLALRIDVDVPSPVRWIHRSFVGHLRYGDEEFTPPVVSV